MSKGSGRRNEDSQKVRDNWGAIKWDREAEQQKNQELRARLDAMTIGTGVLKDGKRIDPREMYEEKKE